MIDIEELFEAAQAGHRRSLGKLLTLVERQGEAAAEISKQAHQKAGQAHVIGVTGAPGVGKSTITGRLAEVSGASRPAILAVDPSSPVSGGAILGDRIRMDHNVGEGVFIRSMATRGHVGGLAVAVPDAVRVLDAVGCNPVMVETVGVGQVEVGIAAATDTTVVVVTPGWGDAVQANKAGLLEVADVFVVNKADRAGASGTRRDLELMLDLGHQGGWRAPIVLTEATEGGGIEDLWVELERHAVYLRDSGELCGRRHQRLRDEVTSRLELKIRDEVISIMESGRGKAILDQVTRQEVSPAAAAEVLLGAVNPSLPNQGSEDPS